MRIEVKDPDSSRMLELEANPSENNREPGWTIILPAGDSIFITLTEGQWNVRNNNEINLEFVKAIGEAIQSSPGRSEQRDNSSSMPGDNPEDDNAEKLLEQKKGSEIREDNLNGNTEPKS